LSGSDHNIQEAIGLKIATIALHIYYGNYIKSIFSQGEPLLGSINPTNKHKRLEVFLK